MRTASTNFLYFSYPLTFAIIISLIVPSIAVSQEVGVFAGETTPTTTPEIIPPLETEIATTTATTTKETIEPMSESPQTGEVLGATTDENSEEEIVENTPQPMVESQPPHPSLSIRRFERKITVDKKAVHTCEAETFRIDISGRASAEAQVMFLRDTDAPYEIEIGGLPDGIDVTFVKNTTYQYLQGTGDRYLTLLIHNQTGSQKGDFSIPIVYTQKASQDSSVICQINIVNQ